MVFIYDPDYAGNPDNGFFVAKSSLLKMDWKEFRTLYRSLDDSVRKEVDDYLYRVSHMETWEYIRKIREAEEKSSFHSIQFSTGLADCLV
jgi:hypothetical protein